MIRKPAKLIATLVAAATVATAVPAGAQMRGEPGRDRGAAWNRDRAEAERRAERRDERRQQWRYYGGRYGYDGYRGRWRTGERFPHYRERQYYVTDYGRYGLPAPRRGYRYYRTDNGDIVMAAIGSGIIGLIIGGAISR